MDNINIFSILSRCGFDNWLTENANSVDLTPQKEYNIFDLLELTGRVNHAVGDPDSFGVVMVLVKILETIKPTTDYPFLVFAFKEQMMRNLCKTSEFSLHGIFKKNPSLFIPGAELVDSFSEERNMPDALIKVEGKIRTVEIKLHKIDERAIKQALRYMKAYQSDKVYVLAPVLTANLPDNVEYFYLDKPKNNVDIQTALKIASEIL